MRTKLFVLLTILGIVVSACAPATSPTPEVIEKTVVQTQIVEVTPMPGPIRKE